MIRRTVPLGVYPLPVKVNEVPCAPLQLLPTGQDAVETVRVGGMIGTTPVPLRSTKNGDGISRVIIVTTASAVPAVVGANLTENEKLAFGARVTGNEVCSVS